MSEKEMRDLWSGWANAQKELWDGWIGLVSQGAAGQMATKMAEEWQGLVNRSLDGMLPDRESVARQTADQLVSAQNAMMKFMEMSAQAWREMGQGDSWGRFLEVARPPGFAAPAALVDDAQKLWQQYWEQWQALGRQWGLDPTAGTAGDSYEQTVGKWLKSPTLGLTREFNEKVRQGFDAWMKMQRSQNAYQERMNQTWTEAYQRFMESVRERERKEQPFESAREMMLAWTSFAEEVFIEAFRSEGYVKAQAELLNTQMAYRLRQRAIMEVFLKMFDLPTRDEVDEAHRRIYELRKEVKALRKEMASLKETPKRPARRKGTAAKEVA